MVFKSGVDINYMTMTTIMVEEWGDHIVIYLVYGDLYNGITSVSSVFVWDFH